MMALREFDSSELPSSGGPDDRNDDDGTEDEAGRFDQDAGAVRGGQHVQ
jgi:hypothetical protein